MGRRRRRNYLAPVSLRALEDEDYRLGDGQTVVPTAKGIRHGSASELILILEGHLAGPGAKAFSASVTRRL
jgi:hypothetical protein